MGKQTGLKYVHLKLYYIIYLAITFIRGT